MPLFGTDGVRGVANRDLTPELAVALGRAAVGVLGDGRSTVVIGRDTRGSGPLLESALASGICSAGADVLLAGVVPTPAVAFLTVELGAAAGAVISASHNPPEDNGIKFFSRQGFKLAEETEADIERLVATGHGPRAAPTDVGRVGAADAAAERYLTHLAEAAEASLDGMRVVIDCANGAASGLAPALLRRLGAEVHAINDAPDGTNINVAAGATEPEGVAAAVRDLGADAGVAYDGDADRAMFADPEGEVIDGDGVIAACALALKEDGNLPKDAVVVTVMANLGLRRALEEAGITVFETPVGDRHVLHEMLRTGAALGGEPSGHVVFLDRATTGDGLLTSVRFLTLAARTGASVAELAMAFRRFPQVLLNVPSPDPRAAAGGEAVRDAVVAAEEALGERGRVVVRPSGTEPVVRVMVEAEDEEEARRHATAVAEAVGSRTG